MQVGGSSSGGGGVVTSITGSSAGFSAGGLGAALAELSGGLDAESIGSFTVGSESTTGPGLGLGHGQGQGQPAFFDVGGDAAPSQQHLLVRWGADQVHSEAMDESLLGAGAGAGPGSGAVSLSGVATPAALADALLREHGAGRANGVAK